MTLNVNTKKGCEAPILGIFFFFISPRYETHSNSEVLFHNLIRIPVKKETKPKNMQWKGCKMSHKYPEEKKKDSYLCGVFYHHEVS